MKKLFLWGLVVGACMACRNTSERDTTSYSYYDMVGVDTVTKGVLHAVTNEEYLEYGSSIAFLNNVGDTIIPFGKYAYFGDDSLQYYANVILHPDDTTYGRLVAISYDQNILFDLVMYDNGPEPFNEGLTRVLRSGKMGYANQYGQVVIPCIYDYARWFKDGKAEVTFDAVEYYDLDEHRRVESDEWFEIDKNGGRLPISPKQ